MEILGANTPTKIKKTEIPDADSDARRKKLGIPSRSEKKENVNAAMYVCSAQTIVL